MVQVSVDLGILEGEEVQNEYGGSYYSFKGIPYAQSPVGELRFKAPQPPLPWTGTRSAKHFGHRCYQFNKFDPNPDTMSEDCLYLNVYTPNVKPEKFLPVMVWIHGGRFTWGSGNDDFYGPQLLVKHGVILVTLNYRLEALGFLCLHTADIPGNAGVKDQVAALRWVKKNIYNFGGDPDNITIFGESAGAGCVSYHLISPMSRGLFRRAIAQSGSVACWWSQDFESRDRTLFLAKQLGCFSDNDEVLCEFLKKQPVESLVNLKLKIWKAQKLYEIDFSIANEKDFGQERFFYGDVTDELRNSIQEGVEIMTGYAKDEGLLALASGCPLNQLTFEANHFNEFFVPKWIKTHTIIADQLEVGRKMRQFYFKAGHLTKENLFKFLSMDFFVYGIIIAGKFYARKNKVYFYEFNCTSERNFFSDQIRNLEPSVDKSTVCHADDLAYLFPIKFKMGKMDESSETFKLVTTVTALWTNFAKYGNPTPDKSMETEWRPYSLQDQEYLKIGKNLITANSPNKEELAFWESIFEEYLPKYTVK